MKLGGRTQAEVQDRLTGMPVSLDARDKKVE